MPNNCTPPPITVMEQFRGVRIYLDPNVQFTSTFPECSAMAGVHAQEWLQWVRVNLSAAGFDVISDANAPRTAVGKIAVQANKWCGHGGKNYDGQAQLMLEPGASVDVPFGWHGADDLVRRLVEMPQVLDLATSAKNAAPAPATPAPPPPPTTSPAAVSPPSEPPAPAVKEGGCMKDSDCKGERICEKGQCITPSAPSSSSPSPAKPATPSPGGPKGDRGDGCRRQCQPGEGRDARGCCSKI
jgi:hypothetical protein